jgi:hypothetical protein
MSRKGQDILSLDAHDIDDELMRLLSIHLVLVDCSQDTSGRVLSSKAKKILKQSGVIDKTCTMVGDDGGNLRTAIEALGTGVLALGALPAYKPLACKALCDDPPRIILCVSHAINGACNGAVRTSKMSQRL